MEVLWMMKTFYGDNSFMKFSIFFNVTPPKIRTSKKSKKPKLLLVKYFRLKTGGEGGIS